jgi:hypothetical protein
MTMKKIQLYIAALFSLLIMSACNSYKDADDVSDVDYMTVDLKATSALSSLSSLDGLTVKFDNYTEDLHYTRTMKGTEMNVSGIIPGIYSITISGDVFDDNGVEYYVNGGVVNQPIYPGKATVDVAVNGLKISPLVFKEIYYACTRTAKNTPYILDEFYELYNNSTKTLYLDGLYFADLYPTTASTTKLPVWPTADGSNYCYANRVWKFPGTGTQYPLAPGESCVISEFAVNHKLEIYNPNSPIDQSSAEFEFNMGSTTYPDQPAVNMIHIFYKGKSEIGTVKQYLTSVFGGAYVVFQVPAGETWDPVNDTSLQTKDLSTTLATLYAKIPIKYVLDAVECGQNETMITAKRVPQVLDAGMTYVGSTYCGLSVSRKRATDSDGNVLIREDGTLMFQDTNNSTDDFDRGLIPMLRRYNTKMPSWNHTLSGE